MDINSISSYLDIDSNKRPISRYDESLLLASNVFDKEVADRIISFSRLSDEKYSQRDLEKLLIDLSWASSSLEGNTYSLLDTQALIAYGEAAEGKSEEETLMILNHKRAIEGLLDSKTVSTELVFDIHQKLMDESGCKNSRHFLPKDKCGVIREYSPNGFLIYGSSYIPAQVEDVGVDFIPEQLDVLIVEYNKIDNPISKSFYLFTRFPYLQPFEDGNKRTSRLVCNAPLIENSLSPLSFVDFNKKDYLKGLLSFYELGVDEYAKDAFVNAYTSSILRYKNFDKETKFSIVSDLDNQIKYLTNYFMSGALDSKSCFNTIFEKNKFSMRV